MALRAPSELCVVLPWNPGRGSIQSPKHVLHFPVRKLRGASVRDIRARQVACALGFPGPLAVRLGP